MNQSKILCYGVGVVRRWIQGGVVRSIKWNRENTILSNLTQLAIFCRRDDRLKIKHLLLNINLLVWVFGVIRYVSSKRFK